MQRSPGALGCAAVRLYALVAEDTVVDWYVARDDAYVALRECLSELPDWKDSLVVWPFEFEFNPN